MKELNEFANGGRAEVLYAQKYHRHLLYTSLRNYWYKNQFVFLLLTWTGNNFSFVLLCQVYGQQIPLYFTVALADFLDRSSLPVIVYTIKDGVCLL